MHFQSVCVVSLLAARLAAAEIPKPTDAPAPRTPDETAASYKLLEGFRLEVIASEPLIASPSGVCWDERGRMFVSELHGYNLEGQLDVEELNKSGLLDTKVRRVQADEKFKRAADAGTYGVVKLLRDANGDGRMDNVEVWATNLPPAYGLVAARGGVIVACAPHILYLADPDGDGRAEIQEKLFTGFAMGALERGINAPQWGLDGWIYFGRGWGGGEISGPHLEKPVNLPGSDFRIRADGSAIEPVTGSTHTFGFALSETGDRFVVTTTVPGIFVAPLPWRYLARNPDAAFSNLEAPTGDRRAYSISKPHPWRQKRADDPAYFEYYRSRYGAAESEADGWFTAACGPMIYHDRALPGLHGQYFVCEPSGNLIHRAAIQRNGSALELERVAGEEKSEFAASSDAWSHPMNLTHGPDGSIWIVDYYREIIEDYSAIPRHLQQQYGVYKGHDRGRIYRLTHRDAPAAPSSDMSALSSGELARECGSSLLWRRQTAQRLIVERGWKSSAAALRELLRAEESGSVITALRTLEQLDELNPADVRSLIGHKMAVVRVHALQVGDRWLSSDRERFEAVLRGAERESDPRAQIQFALSLGESRDSRAFAMLAKYAREHMDVRWMDAALLSSLKGRGSEMLTELKTKPGANQGFVTALSKAAAVPRKSTERKTANAATVTAPQAISEVTFQEYLVALKEKRDLKRGHELFLRACTSCHRIGNEGQDIAPDLMGQIGMGDEALLQDLLMPNTRIRPGFETAIVELNDGEVAVGILKEEGPTSVTVALPNLPNQIILRKEIASVRRVHESLMPSFAETLKPDEVADVLAWLRRALSKK
jgi:putative membrane-bound dehydrogenase-like protein